MSTAELFDFPASQSPLSPGFPDGFHYRSDLIDQGAEADLIAHLDDLPFRAFDFHGFSGKRLVSHFGWRYDYGKAALEAAAPIPDFLLPLRARAAAFAGVEAEAFEQALVNQYPPGAGIGWHRDKPMFDKVVAVSLGAPAVLRLRRREGDGFVRAKREVAPRSAYLLSGDARDVWEHSVPAVEALRYSVTFRTFRAGRRPHI
jgi:alkylated DNA repair dioxygenase AlkB